MDKKDFRKTIKYRLAEAGMTQREFAEKLGITDAYLSNLIKCISDTQVAELWRDKIVKTLDELESGCPVEK